MKYAENYLHSNLGTEKGKLKKMWKESVRFLGFNPSSNYWHSAT